MAKPIQKTSKVIQNIELSTTYFISNLSTFYTKVPSKLLTDLNTVKGTPKTVHGIRKPTEDEVNEFISDLANELSCVYLSTHKEHCTKYIPLQVKEQIPNPLYKLFDSSLLGKPLCVLIEKAHSLIPSLAISENQSCKIFDATKSQSQSKIWKQQRIGRCTASNMKAILDMDLDNPSDSIIDLICHPRPFTSQSTKYSISELAGFSS